jgi:hypothetical protein
MAKIALSDLRSQYAEIFPPVDKTVDKSRATYRRGSSRRFCSFLMRSTSERFSGGNC